MTASIPAARTAPRRSARSGDRIFYTSMAVAIALAVFLGFARTYYLRSHFDPAPLLSVLQLHGIVFSAWIALFVLQTSLIAAGRTPTHRAFGWAGAGLAVLMVIVALSAAVVTGRRDLGLGYGDESFRFFATPVLAMLVFAILLGIGVAARRRAEMHKRCMLLATISLLDAAIARWPFPALVTPALGVYGIADAFIVVGILYDVATRRAVHPAYVWGGLLIVAGQLARAPLGATAWWQSFASLILE